MRRLRWTAAALTVAALALPAAAGATTASINGYAIVINDPQGITDHITIAPGGTDQSGLEWNISGVTAGQGCAPSGGGAFCSDNRFQGTLRSFQITLNGGDDTLTYGVATSVNGGNPTGTIDMGAGNDTVTSSAVAAHTILGGAGSDTITLTGFAPGGSGVPTSGPTPAPVTIDGGTENDMIDASGRSSADVINGGAGTDTVTYANRATAVTVTLDDVANDGFHGSSTVENDNVHTDVENITGSPASDALTGDAAANVLSGLGGNDRIDALGGDDTMLGGAGDDTIGPLPPTVGTPICFINPFTHIRICTTFLFVTTATPDGIDTIDGGAGNDHLNSTDGLADQPIQCGTGIDSADVDLFDPATLPGCESVFRGAVDQHPLVRILGARPGAEGSGKVRVALACTREHARLCRGTLALGRGDKTIARAHYSIKRNHAKAVTLELRGSAKRAAARSHGVRVLVVASEVDQQGRPLTSQKRLRVRVR